MIHYPSCPIPDSGVTSRKTMKTKENGNDPLADGILNYLSSRPGAQDTLEGIAAWWLSERHVQKPKAPLHAHLMNWLRSDWSWRARM